MLELSDFYAATGGFDAIGNETVDVTADPNTPTQGIFKGITDVVAGLAGVFNNGVEIYKSVAGQYNAAIAISKESGTPATTVITTPGASLLTKDNLIKIGIVVAIGAAVLLLVRKR